MRSKRILLSDKDWMPSSKSLSSYLVPDNPEILLIAFFWTFSRLSQSHILQGLQTGVAYSKWGLTYCKYNFRNTFLSLKSIS